MPGMKIGVKAFYSNERNNGLIVLEPAPQPTIMSFSFSTLIKFNST